MSSVNVRFKIFFQKNGKCSPLCAIGISGCLAVSASSHGRESLVKLGTQGHTAGHMHSQIFCGTLIECFVRMAELVSVSHITFRVAVYCKIKAGVQQWLASF